MDPPRAAERAESRASDESKRARAEDSDLTSRAQSDSDLINGDLDDLRAAENRRVVSRRSFVDPLGIKMKLKSNRPVSMRSGSC